MISSEGFKQAYRQREADFTRSRVLSFVGLVVSQINRLSRSLSVEVSRLVERLFGTGTDYTKQAYSQYRNKLRAEAFTALNQHLIQGYYADGQYRTWQGFLLLASDGSTLQLPQSQELEQAFGLAENKGRTMPMGRISLFYDVENELVLQALLEPYKASEQHMLLRHLDHLQALLLPGPCLLLLDRGYPSLWLLACLQQRQQAFLMRCNADFVDEVAVFAQSPEQDKLLVLDLQAHQRGSNKQLQAFLQPGQTRLQVRAVKVALSGGQTELLLTNLPDKVITLGELYHKRWGVETALDIYKNVLEVENFSAKTELGIRQDFHAGMLTANITALLVNSAEAELKPDSTNKHIYRINRSVAIGLVKEKLPDLLVGCQPIEEICDQLRRMIKRRKQPVRNGRSFKRKRPLNYKFKINKRKVI
ncbi:MAG TPA: IS4 family transposase [Adhaeribacter sp.]|nr:IS4 family transposase [Adhaeribacter sp.]